VTSVFLLAGALGLECAGVVPRLPVLTLLGDSSYSLYLVQFFVLNPLRSRLASWPEFLALPVKLAGCAALGLGVYWLLERPLQRLGRCRPREAVRGWLVRLPRNAPASER
jgi:exopolysaccharide production protein ExoZ